MPNWRTNLFNTYYGSPDSNTDFTAEELTLLRQMQEDHVTIRAVMNLQMGGNSKDNYLFYGIWEKTLAEISSQQGAEILQTYLEATETPTMIAYVFDHPSYLVFTIFLIFLILFSGILYIQSVRSKNRQLRISDQLSTALIEAKNANDAKLNFFSKMSHDIRTPLNVVLGMAQIAKKYKHDTSKLDDALDSISKEGNYLLALINSILDVNQLEHGHIELVQKPFNPEECIQESVEILRPLAEKKEQKLFVYCDFKDHVVIGDSGRFSQIMINIISNAIKYTDIGGMISVRMEALTDNRYRFTCTDKGIGMTQEFLQHICEDYARAEDSRTSSTEGTGLGMSVVKGFTDLMGGTLSVKSELGKGSVFTVEIPFEEPSDKQRALILHPTSDSLQTHLHLTGKKVLLVEDNALNAEIAMEFLQSIGLACRMGRKRKARY